MTSEIGLSIVIPCYNEATRLPRTLAETLRYLRTRTERAEIIVVSDGSRDETAAVATAALSGTEDHITHQVIEYRPNGGKGKAVRVGMLAATGERILFMDADYAVPIEALEAATAIIEERGVAIAIGSRAIEQAVVKEHQSFLRERMAKLFGFIQRNYLGLRLMDTQCGFKVFTREAAHRIFERVTLTSVIFDGEMLWLAKRMGYPVAEFPVEWTHDPDTRITYDPWRALRVLLDMLSIPFRHLGRSR